MGRPPSRARESIIYNVSESFFDTYWRGTIKQEVFVAMPFSREFDPIWKRAIKPAIEEDLGNGNYKANRVDVTTISGTIITDILDGIAHATLVFPGISFFSGWR